MGTTDGTHTHTHTHTADEQSPHQVPHVPQAQQAVPLSLQQPGGCGHDDVHWAQQLAGLQSIQKLALGIQG